MCGIASVVNGRKLPLGFGLLRNSTIFRCAKNWDSDSARRKLPKPRGSLSSGLIVHNTCYPTHPPIEQYQISEFKDVRRAMPGGVPENIRPRLAYSPHSGQSASTVRVHKIAQQFLSSCAAAECGECAVAFSGVPPGIDRVSKRHPYLSAVNRKTLTNSQDLYLHCRNHRLRCAVFQ